MNPINWLLLLLFFNSLGLGGAVKLHFLYKELVAGVNSHISLQNGRFVFKV